MASSSRPACWSEMASFRSCWGSRDVCGTRVPASTRIIVKPTRIRRRKSTEPSEAELLPIWVLKEYNRTPGWVAAGRSWLSTDLEIELQCQFYDPVSNLDRRIAKAAVAPELARSVRT